MTTAEKAREHQVKGFCRKLDDLLESDDVLSVEYGNGKNVYKFKDGSTFVHEVPSLEDFD